MRFFGYTELLIDRTSLANNTVGQRGLQGGAIYLSPAGGRIQVQNAIFSSNEAKSGAAVSMMAGDVQSSRAQIQFIHVGFMFHVGNDGATIYHACSSCDLVLEQCLLRNNIATSVAALHQTSPAGMVNVSSSTFQSNSADLTSGAVSLSGRSWIFNSTFHMNHCGGGAGAISLQGTSRVSFTTFMQNLAVSAGSIIANPRSQLTLLECKLDSNQAYSRGGGAILVESATVVVIQNFVGNNQANEGGAIHVNNGVLMLWSSFLSDNAAIQQGGAISSHNSVLQLINNTFQGNAVAEGGTGGVLWLSQNNISAQGLMQGCHFDRNTASQGTILFEADSGTLDWPDYSSATSTVANVSIRSSTPFKFAPQLTGRIWSGAPFTKSGASLKIGLLDRYG